MFLFLYNLCSIIQKAFSTNYSLLFRVTTVTLKTGPVILQALWRSAFAPRTYSLFESGQRRYFLYHNNYTQAVHLDENPLHYEK